MTEMRATLAAAVIGVFATAAVYAQSRPAESGPWSRPATAVAKLERPNGMVSVGSWWVELLEDGTILFEGEPTGELFSICLGGRHGGRVPLDEVEKVRKAFLDAGYLA